MLDSLLRALEIVNTQPFNQHIEGKSTAASIVAYAESVFKVNYLGQSDCEAMKVFRSPENLCIAVLRMYICI